MARSRDLPVIELFERSAAHLSRPLVLVTPASVKGEAWSGKDDGRPLDHRGRRQARALATLIEAYGIRRTLAAHARCCIETLRPLGRTGDISRQTVPPVRGSGAKLRAVLEDLVGLAQEDVPTAVCAEQKVLAGLTGVLTAGDDTWRRRVSRLPHASLCVLHLQTAPTDGRNHVVVAERIVAAR